MAVTLDAECLDALKLRLTLEGCEWAEYDAPHSHVCIRRHGLETYFLDWDSCRTHCEEDWARTYWGPVFHQRPTHSMIAVYNGGGWDAADRHHSRSGPLPVPIARQRV